MTITLAQVRRVVEELWPIAGAEPWDAPGLVTGDPAAPVEAILLAVDVVSATLDEAVETGADLLLAHHPLLLRGVTSVAGDRYKGALIARAIRADCAVLGAHTNADVVAEGTSSVLAARIGLGETRPIVPGDGEHTGLGRVGRLAEPIPLAAVAERLAGVLPATAGGILVAGEAERRVDRIALCAGAGDSLLSHPEVVASDVYITSDLRHHPASEAREQALLSGGPALIDISHWAAESLWLTTARDRLAERLPGVTVTVSRRRTDPWDFRLDSGRAGG